MKEGLQALMDFEVKRQRGWKQKTTVKIPECDKKKEVNQIVITCFYESNPTNRGYSK